MKIRLGHILQTPLVLVVMASFGASIYAAYNGLFDIGWGGTTFLGTLLILYFIGAFMKKSKLEGK